MSHLVIFMIVIYQISLDFYSPKTKDFFSKTRSVTCFILHLKTEGFQTLIFSKYDTVENKRINIGIFDISNVTFSNMMIVCESNKYSLRTCICYLIISYSVAGRSYHLDTN